MEQGPQKQIRVPLQVDFSCRDLALTKDGKVQNGVVEKAGNRVRVKQRPGTVPVTNSTVFATAAGASGLGLFFQTNTLSGPIVGFASFTAPSTYTVTFIKAGIAYSLVLATTHETPTFFTATTDLDTILFFTPDGVTGTLRSWNAGSHAFGTVTKPANMVFSQLVLFDNYIFGMNFGTGEVFNGALAAPTTAWSALDFIDGFQQKQQGRGLFQHGNYLVAVGASETAFFYDAGNLNGSPLSVYQSASQPVGCLFTDSLASANGSHFWLAVGKDGGVFVAMLAVNETQVKHVSSQAVDLLLVQLLTNFHNPIDPFGVKGACLAYQGKLLYTLEPDQSTIFPFTLVYDSQAGLWYVWNKNDGPFDLHNAVTTTDLFGQDGTFNPTMPAQPQPVTLLLFGHSATGKLCVLAPEAALDSDGTTTSDIDLIVQTELVDFDLMFQKQHQRAILVGDLNETVDGVATLSFTDDDYATFSTPEAIAVSAANDIPQWRNLAAARRRAYKFEYSTRQLRRFEALELSIEAGSN